MNARALRGPGGRFQKREKLDKETTIRVLKHLWKYIKKYPLNLFIVAIAILVTSAFSLILPTIIKIIIDDYIEIEVVNLSAILIIAIAVISSTILIGVFNYFQFYLMAIASSKATKEIRKEAFDKLINLPISYYDTNQHGVIMSKLTIDVETLNNALSQVIPQMITTVITIIGAIVLMLITSWQLAIVSLTIIPIMVFLIIFISKRTYKHFYKQQEKIGSINGIVEENISGLKVVKLYNQEQEMISKFSKANEEWRKASFRGQLYAGMIMPLVRLVDNLLYGLIVSIGALLSIRYGVVTVGSIQAITNYSKMSTRPINNLAQLFNIIQTAIAGGDRVFKIIEQADEYINETKAMNEQMPQKVRGDVEFKNVTFSYEENKPVLNNVNFSAKAGTVIAIVGPTGGGKTTIINLLTRYYDTQQGEIRIDNQNIYQLPKMFARRHVGIVLQTTYLFKGTVLENIKYGNHDASDEDVIAAAKLAHVHEIIERLPRKYKTRVKEGGINFSHGERQLISIARTILSNPSILVLDEATSSVDTRTETNIQKSMLTITKNRTSFIIAHRLQTIKNADIILVISDGKIIEQGSHQQLLDKNGLYYEMYTTQFQITE